MSEIEMANPMGKSECRCALWLRLHVQTTRSQIGTGIADRHHYRLMYIHAASANRRTVVTQSDESLMPVFLAIVVILIPSVNSGADAES